VTTKLKTTPEITGPLSLVATEARKFFDALGVESIGFTVSHHPSKPQVSLRIELMAAGRNDVQWLMLSRVHVEAQAKKILDTAKTASV